MPVVFDKKDMDVAAMTTNQREAVGMYLRGENWAEYVSSWGKGQGKTYVATFIGQLEEVRSEGEQVDSGTPLGHLEMPERFVLGAYLAGEEREVQWVPRNHDSEGRLSRLVDELEQLKRSYLASAAVPEDDAEPQNEQEGEPAGITAAKGIGAMSETNAAGQATPCCGWECCRCHKEGYEKLQMKAEICRLRTELDAWKKLTAEAWEAGAAWAASDPEWCRRKKAGF